MIERIIVRVTARIWNRIASRVLNAAYERKQIDSRVLHILAAEFDPTQDGAVRRIMRGHPNPHAHPLAYDPKVTP